MPIIILVSLAFPISVEAVVAAGIAPTSGCGFGPVSSEGLQNKVEREAMVATFHPSQAKTKTVVMIFFFQYCLSLIIIGRIFLLSVGVHFQGRFCLAFCFSDAVLIISLQSHI